MYAAHLSNQSQKSYCQPTYLLQNPTKSSPSKSAKRCLKCKDNPNCLNSIGADLWFQQGLLNSASLSNIDALSLYSQAQGLSENEDPERDLRSGPVGLRVRIGDSWDLTFKEFRSYMLFEYPSPNVVSFGILSTWCL